MSQTTGTYYFPFYSGGKIMPYRVKGQRQIMYTSLRKPPLRIPPVPRPVPRQVPQQVIEPVHQPIIESIQVEYYQLQPSRRLLRDSPRHKKAGYVEEEYPRQTICSIS